MEKKVDIGAQDLPANSNQEQAQFGTLSLLMGVISFTHLFTVLDRVVPRGSESAVSINGISDKDPSFAAVEESSEGAHLS